MKLILAADDGTILDSTDDFTREEWNVARQSTLGAVAMLQDLNADAR